MADPIPEVARVQVRSAWLSKINWTAVGGAVMTLVTTNALGLDDATQVKVLAGSTVVQSILTIVFKTFFTPTVTPASLSSVKE